MKAERLKAPPIKPRLAVRRQGRLVEVNSIELALTGATGTIEIFELHSIGYYRRKIEVEKVEFEEIEPDDEDDDKEI